MQTNTVYNFKNDIFIAFIILVFLMSTNNMLIMW